MKLSDYAKLKGVSYRTAWNWFNNGMIPNANKLPNGTILVDHNQQLADKKERVVIYCRVSNASRRKELEYQVKRAEDFCAANGYVIDKIYKEVASGMNDSRKQLWAAIDSSPTKIIVENKDRLTRFGYEYLYRLLAQAGTEVIVMNKDATDEQDLMRDLVSIITSFCCRLYGLRRAKNKIAKIKAQVYDNT